MFSPSVVSGQRPSPPSHAILISRTGQDRRPVSRSQKQSQPSTVMPIDRAVPAMIFAAWSMSLALRSSILVCAISRTWSIVTFATFLVCGSPLPLSTPAAFSSSRAAGGVLVTKVNERSSETEISTGTICPRCDSVAALYALQNSMMLTPCWPSAGPTGGAGFAAPAWIWSLMIAASFFLGGMSLLFFSTGCLDLRDLAEGQLDGRLAAED